MKPAVAQFLKSASDRRALLTAAAMLAEDAKLLVESCQGHPRTSKAARWACGDCPKVKDGKCKAQLDHEARLQAESNLRAMARRAASPV